MFITGRPWEDRYLRVFLVPDGDTGAGAQADITGNESGIATGDKAGNVGNQDQGGDGNDQESVDAQIAKLKADLARQKAALDKATSEANGYKKELRAKQSAEEIAAAEAKAAEEARNAELESLRKQFAVMETRKNIAVKLGGSDEASGKIAEYLYGAEDADAVIAEFQKILAAQEKKLRQEYGKVPPPGAGSASGEDAELQRAIKLAQEIGRERADSGKSVKERLGGYVR